MKTIKVKNVIIGEGMPKICVPLVPEKLEQLSAEAAMARESGWRRRDYYSVIRDIIDECDPDIIDIEGIDQENEDWFDMVEFITNMAHENDIVVILSNHDFDKTPPMEEIVKRLCVMAEMGADIPKVAYMPRKHEDVDTVIHAAAVASEYFDKPFIALSMSKEGLPSRICSGQSGTAITFAAASGKSAPGQVRVSEMQELLRRFYDR